MMEASTATTSTSNGKKSHRHKTKTQANSQTSTTPPLTPSGLFSSSAGAVASPPRSPNSPCKDDPSFSTSTGGNTNAPTSSSSSSSLVTTLQTPQNTISPRPRSAPPSQDAGLPLDIPESNNNNISQVVSPWKRNIESMEKILKEAGVFQDHDEFLDAILASIPGESASGLDADGHTLDNNKLASLSSLSEALEKGSNTDRSKRLSSGAVSSRFKRLSSNYRGDGLTLSSTLPMGAIIPKSKKKIAKRASSNSFSDVQSARDNYDGSSSLSYESDPEHGRNSPIRNGVRADQLPVDPSVGVLPHTGVGGHPSLFTMLSQNEAQLAQKIRRLQLQERELLKSVSRLQRLGFSSGVKKSKFKGVMDLRAVEFGHLLGVGASCATVVACVVDGWHCAAKRINRNFSSLREIESFESEVAILSSLPPHPCVVRFLFYDLVDPHQCLFIEQYSTTLRSFINRLKTQSSLTLSSSSSSSAPPLQRSGSPPSLEELQKKPNGWEGGQQTVLSPSVVVKCVQKVAQGMAHLHQNQVIHRDIKADNIFINTSDDDSITKVAVGDFDTAIRVTSTDPITEVVGTTGFMAPEVLDGRPYDFRADVYAFGMLIYELMTSMMPFHEESSPNAICKHVLAGDRPNIDPEIENAFRSAHQDGTVPCDLIDIFHFCTEFNPSARPASFQVLCSLLRIEPVVSTTAPSFTPPIPLSLANSSGSSSSSFASTSLRKSATNLAPPKKSTKRSNTVSNPPSSSSSSSITISAPLSTSGSTPVVTKTNSGSSTPIPVPGPPQIQTPIPVPGPTPSISSATVVRVATPTPTPTPVASAFLVPPLPFCPPIAIPESPNSAHVSPPPSPLLGSSRDRIIHSPLPATRSPEHETLDPEELESVNDQSLDDD